MYSESPSEQKPVKNLGENGAWAYTGSAHIFCVPPRYIRKVHANKSPLKFWEEMERGRIQGLLKFLEYPLLSEERVKLRTSNFVRTFLVLIGTKVHYKFVEK